VPKSLSFDRIVMFVLLCYPVLFLTVRGGMNALFFLMVITSFIYLFRLRKFLESRLWDGYSIAFAIAMASPILAVLLSQAYHGNFTAPPLDGPSRFLFAIPIFLALRQTDERAVTFLQYSLPLGSLSAFFISIIAQRNLFSDNLYFVNRIHFGDSALMLGILSLLCINWSEQDRAPLMIFKICGLLAGMYLSVQSGARGGWIAAPVLMLIWWKSHSHISWIKLLIAILAFLLTASLVYALVGTVHSRLDMIYQDLVDFQQGNKDTSIGIRLQLWQTAIYLFFEHPFFGVGPGGFAQHMGPLYNSGMLTSEAARLGHGEVHNELLAKAAELGIFGFLSILSVFAVPLALFLQSIRSPSAQTRRAAFMGICLVAGFFIFGLTVEIFNLKMTVSFYSLTLVLLLSAVTNKVSYQDSHV